MPLHRLAERYDFTRMIRDAAHLHRNEDVRAGPYPHGGDVLTTKTGLGGCQNQFHLGGQHAAADGDHAPCLLTVKMALTADNIRESSSSF